MDKPKGLGLIEKDWIDYRMLIMPKAVPDVQEVETKRAFYAGAGCVFHAIMNMLDPGTEPTEKDLLKMDELHNEITTWLEEQKRIAEEKAPRGIRGN